MKKREHKTQPIRLDVDRALTLAKAEFRQSRMELVDEALRRFPKIKKFLPKPISTFRNCENLGADHQQPPAR